jgi:hypothetical protein
VHRLLSMVTDVIIEFTRAQLEAIGPNPARPGHSACLSRSRGRMTGIGLSDDLATVVSPAIYERFCRPYNERIAAALGGAVIHSCGVWRPPIISTVAATRGLAGVELALSTDDDPSPSAPEVIRDGFAGTGLPVKARIGRDFLPVVDRVYHPGLRFIPQIAWDDDPSVRDRNYETLHARMAVVGGDE